MRNKILSQNLLPPTQHPFFHILHQFQEFSSQVLALISHSKPLDTDWIYVFVLTDQINFIVFTYAPVNHCGIYNAGI